MTTPWAANAASPWSSTGITLSPRSSPRRSWRARTEPSTTGFDDLEVRRVEGQRHVHVAAGRTHVARESLVILDVAGALELLEVVLAFEFRKQVGGRLAEHVDQHVQAAAMRHAEDDVLDAVHAAALDQVVEQRDQAVATLEREPLLRRVLGREIALETFGHRQAPQDVSASSGVKCWRMRPTWKRSCSHRRSV